MHLFRAVRAVAGASGEGPVDWAAVTEAAKATTDAGSLALTERDREGYVSDVRTARTRVREVTRLGFDLPGTVQVQHRHHWIDANVDTFRRVMAPLENRKNILPGLARSVNTATLTVTLSFLANNVLGQYDPLLLADGDDHALYFVHPNIQRVADTLDVDRERFRRWIAFHEVTHAAEFGAAPWLSTHLERRMERTVDALVDGRFDRDALRELDAAMTAVEGYADLVMDRAFDESATDLRAKLEARRRGRGPVARLVRRLLGLGMKRRQYERGKAFFEAVVDARGIEAAGAVWSHPDNLPTDEELDNPGRWLARVG